jgi:hypothetical protein
MSASTRMFLEYVKATGKSLDEVLDGPIDADIAMQCCLSAVKQRKASMPKAKRKRPSKRSNVIAFPTPSAADKKWAADMGIRLD